MGQSKFIQCTIPDLYRDLTLFVGSHSGRSSCEVGLVLSEYVNQAFGIGSGEATSQSYKIGLDKGN